MIEARYIYKARVTNVIDGDTIDIVLDLGFYMKSTLRVRLLRVNTFELNSKIPEEKLKALEAKSFVIDQVLNKDVIVETHKSDAFGRWLAEVWFISAGIQQNLNDLLLSSDLARPYSS